MAKTAKGIIKDLAQDVETAASNVLAEVEACKELPDGIRLAYERYEEAVERLERATGAGA